MRKYSSLLSGQRFSALFHAQNTQACPDKLSRSSIEPINVQSVNMSSPDSSARKCLHVNTGFENVASSFFVTKVQLLEINKNKNFEISKGY